MPKISLQTRNQPLIGELRDVVVVCTTTERPDDWVSTIVERPGVFRCHARIRDLAPEQIIDYRAVFGSENIPSKEVTIRCPPDVKVDLNHSVFRETGVKMWLRVRGVEDLGEVHRFLALRCSIDTLLDERTDPATQQMPPVFEIPSLD